MKNCSLVLYLMLLGWSCIPKESHPDQTALPSNSTDTLSPSDTALSIKPIQDSLVSVSMFKADTNISRGSIFTYRFQSDTNYHYAVYVDSSQSTWHFWSILYQGQKEVDKHSLPTEAAWYLLKAKLRSVHTQTGIKGLDEAAILIWNDDNEEIEDGFSESSESMEYMNGQILFGLSDGQLVEELFIQSHDYFWYDLAIIEEEETTCDYESYQTENLFFPSDSLGMNNRLVLMRHLSERIECYLESKRDTCMGEYLVRKELELVAGKWRENNQAFDSELILDQQWSIPTFSAPAFCEAYALSSVDWGDTLQVLEKSQIKTQVHIYEQLVEGHWLYVILPNKDQKAFLFDAFLYEELDY